MLVKDILHEIDRPLAKLGEDARLVDAAKRLHGPDASLVVVCSADGRMAGVVGKTDVVDRISHCTGAGCGMPLSSVMTRDVTCCRPDTPLREVWATMTSRGLRHVPVLDTEGRPQGVIAARQVMQAPLSDVEHEEELLRDYVMCIGYR